LLWPFFLELLFEDLLDFLLFFFVFFVLLFCPLELADSPEVACAEALTGIANEPRPNMTATNNAKNLFFILNSSFFVS
jgi:hypothetical protein